MRGCGPRQSHDLYILLSLAGYDVVQPPSLRVRTMPRSAQRPVSIVKASNMEDQQRNKEELRNLDHREVRTVFGEKLL